MLSIAYYSLIEYSCFNADISRLADARFLTSDCCYDVRYVNND